MADEKDSLSNDIASAIEKLEKGESGEQAQKGGNAGGETPQGEQRADGSEAQQPEGDQTPTEKEQISQSGKSSEKPALGPDGKPLPSLKKFKAPGSWKPEVREKFSALDIAVQEEIARREADMDRGMRQVTDARKFKTEFDEAVKPYMHFFEAENATPLQAMVNMFNTAAKLRTETPQNKAWLVGNLIRQFNVDIPMLDSYLAGQPPAQGGSAAPASASGAVVDQVLQAVRQQFGPMFQYVDSLRQRDQGSQEQVSKALNESIEQFAGDANNEFFEDVREDMADILEMGANRGQKISLQDAYNRAIMLHPTISQIVAQRKLSGQAAQLNAAAERAQNAAVSVRGDTPSRSEEPKSDGTLRGDLELAFDAVSKRAGGR